MNFIARSVRFQRTRQRLEPESADHLIPFPPAIMPVYPNASGSSVFTLSRQYMRQGRDSTEGMPPHGAEGQATMVLVVYRRTDGTYLLMPNDSPARKPVKEMHGPLVLCTYVTIRDIENRALQTKVLADIVDHSYSMIHETIGRHFISVTCGPARACPDGDAHPIAA